METEVRLVSDLHLRPSDLENVQALASFLAGGDSNSVLCFLGDLFDYWVGAKQLRQEGWREIVALLKNCSETGRKLYFLHGNRDYQLDRAFERATGGKVVAGGLLLERAAQERLLCLHGDELCLNDLPYQKAKKKLRSWPLRLLTQSLPFKLAQGFADRARERSRYVVGKASSQSLLPSRRAIDELCACGFTHLCFGHIHQPGQAEFEGARGSLRFWVLPAFNHENPGFAIWRRGGLQLFENAETMAWPCAVRLGP